LVFQPKKAHPCAEPSFLTYFSLNSVRVS